MTSTASNASHFPLDLLVAASVWLVMAVAGGEVVTYTAAPRGKANSVQTRGGNVESVVRVYLPGSSSSARKTWRLAI